MQLTGADPRVDQRVVFNDNGECDMPPLSSTLIAKSRCHAMTTVFLCSLPATERLGFDDIEFIHPVS